MLAELIGAFVASLWLPGNAWPATNDVSHRLANDGLRLQADLQFADGEVDPRVQATARDIGELEVR
jgi:hypothetical protein